MNYRGISGSWQGTVGFFPLEGEVRLVFEEAQKLPGCEYGAEFDVAVFFDKVDALARFETQSSPNFLWDDNLIFG